MKNNDPTAPWNDWSRRDDPDEIWNDQRYRNDPTAPWNDPGSTERDYEKYRDYNGKY